MPSTVPHRSVRPLPQDVASSPSRPDAAAFYRREQRRDAFYIAQARGWIPRWLAAFTNTLCWEADATDRFTWTPRQHAKHQHLLTHRRIGERQQRRMRRVLEAAGVLERLSGGGAGPGRGHEGEGVLVYRVHVDHLAQLANRPHPTTAGKREQKRGTKKADEKGDEKGDETPPILTLRTFRPTDTVRPTTPNGRYQPPPTFQERNQAHEIRRQWGRCEHRDRECVDYGACVDRIADKLAGRR